MIMINMQKKSKYLPCFMGIFAFTMGYFFIPSNDSYDIYRHYLNFRYLPFEQYMRHAQDYYLIILVFFLRKLKLSENFIGAFSCSVIYYFITKSYFIILEKQKKISSKNNVFWLTLLILSVPFIFFNGIRFCTAFSFYIYGIVRLHYKREYIKSFLFFTLASLSHFSIIPLVIMIYVYIGLRNKISYRTIKILVLLTFIIGNLDLNKGLIEIGAFVNSFDIIHINTNVYIKGEWGTEYGINNNSIGKLVKMLSDYFFKITMLYYVFFQKQVNNFTFKKNISYLIIYCFFIQKFYTAFSRTNIVIFTLIIFSIIKNIDFKFILNKKNICLFLIIINIIYFQFFDLKDHIISYIISYGKIINISLINIIYNNIIK